MPIPPRLAYTCILLVFSFILLSLPPSAQGQVPKGDLFFGYSRTGNDTFYPNVGGLSGWEATGHIKIRKPFLGVEGDVAHYGLGANSSVPRSTTVLFGPRVTLGVAGIKIFGHGLLGGEHSANNNNNPSLSGGTFTYALGVGVDLPLVPFLAWRVQVDRLSAPSQSPSGATHARFTTGIVFRF